MLGYCGKKKRKLSKRKALEEGRGSFVILGHLQVAPQRNGYATLFIFVFRF